MNIREGREASDKRRQLTHQIGIYSAAVIAVFTLLAIVLHAESCWGFREIESTMSLVLAALLFSMLIGAVAYVDIWAVVGWWFLGDHRLRVFCAGCSKHLSTTNKWRCGYCNNVNQQGTILHHSVLRHCGQCKKRPPGIQCPHCDKVNTFSSDGHPGLFATYIDESDPPSQPELDPIDFVLDERAKAIAEREHQVTIARLDAELAELKAKLPKPPRKPRSPREAAEDSFRRTHEHNLSILEVEEREIERLKKKYANNPAKRDHLIEGIKIWSEEQR